MSGKVTATRSQYDLIFVGGGLAAGLAADRILAQWPRTRMLMLEKGAQLGGNHTWSFHTTDLTAAQYDWVRPYVSKTWKGYDVWFPRYERTLQSDYNSIQSEKFHEVLLAKLGDRVRLNADVRSLTPHRVTLADGEQLEAACVIDARGFADIVPGSVAYQKFVGIDLQLSVPHGLTRPTIMDVTCEQRDGFRFFYLLPWSETSLLIEDTRYSATPDVDFKEYESEILDYAHRHGWKVQHQIRHEIGILPIPLRQEIFVRDASFVVGVPIIGSRASFFHSTTGYSLPEAVQLAEELASLTPLTSENLLNFLEKYEQKQFRKEGYYRLLNRMLFFAADPQIRYKIFERFYRLSEGLIQRFYAGKMTLADRVRLLSGKPPVPISRALGCLFE
ncbi:MAG: lycopene beta-cyclase CrtY [Bacteriovoracia bacterium]